MNRVSVRWRGGELAFASAHGDVVRVVPAGLLADGAGCWSPEELLAGAAAASYALSLLEATQRDDLPLIDATLEAACGTTATSVELVRIDATLETLSGYEPDVLAAAAVAERGPVLQALNVPVDVQLHVHAAESAATTSLV